MAKNSPLKRFVTRVLPVGWWMRTAWERRARAAPLTSVADFCADWRGREEEFFQTGRDNVRVFLELAGWPDTQRATLLEIGCGVGRMTRHFAEHFAHVTALDVSPTMIAEAKRLNPDLENVTWVVGSGTDLHGIADASHDFAVSYIVFQHIPRFRVVLRYIRETLRVLKPSGRMRFQAHSRRLTPETNTYYGEPMDLERVRAVARELGWEVIHVEGEGTQYTWVEIAAPGTVPHRPDPQWAGRTTLGERPEEREDDRPGAWAPDGS